MKLTRRVLELMTSLLVPACTVHLLACSTLLALLAPIAALYSASWLIVKLMGKCKICFPIFRAFLGHSGPLAFSLTCLFVFVYVRKKNHLSINDMRQSLTFSSHNAVEDIVFPKYRASKHAPKRVREPIRGSHRNRSLSLPLALHAHVDVRGGETVYAYVIVRDAIEYFIQ